MPLRDHFRSPVNDTHSWDEVHGQWPGEIVRDLTTILPAGYRAAPKVHLGSPFEVDVSAYGVNSPTADAAVGDGAAGAAGTQTALSPTFTVEADLPEPDEYEVRIYDSQRGRQLVAAIEIVSPSNKDRAEARDLFVGKVAALLHQDVCVALVDLVSVRQANLYADLLSQLGRVDPQLAPIPPHLYAVTLRSRRSPKHRPMLDAWFHAMAIGQPLPTLPIWLAPDRQVMLPLESSYQETCRILGIP
jgi:hypothetical protein